MEPNSITKSNSASTSSLKSGTNNNSNGIKNSTSSENILASSMMSSSNHHGGKKAYPTLFKGSATTVNSLANANNQQNINNGGAGGNGSSLNSPDGSGGDYQERVKHLHDFRPHRATAVCVYCGETIRQIWPITSHSYKCYYCGIVCHKKCLDLMNTISCSSATHMLKNLKSSPTPNTKNQHHNQQQQQGTNNKSNENLANSTTPTSTSSNSSPTTSPSNSLTGSLNNSTNPTIVVGDQSTSTSTSTSSSPNTTLTTNNIPHDEDIINSMFESLANDLGLQKAMMSLPLKSKITLLEQHGRLKNVTSHPNSSISASDSAEQFISQLKLDPTNKLLQSLIVHLRTKSVTWFASFIQFDGVQVLLDLLQQKKKETREECVRAIAIVMNNPVGLKAIAEIPSAPKRLAMVLQSKQFELKSRAIVIELLTVMLMDIHVPGGCSLVLKALTNQREKKRFSFFVKFIKENESLEMKTKALCFVNVLIYELDETSVRVNIRSEFNRMGLYDYLKEVKKNLSPDENLYTQIEIFEEMMEDDNQELEQKLDDLKRQLGIDIEDLDAVYKAIKSMASKSGLTKSLLSILQNLLVIKTSDQNEGIKYWLLCDSLIKQISIHKSGFGERDSIDFKGLLQNVDNATKEVTLNRKLEELEKQNIEKAMLLQEKDLNLKSMKELLKQIKASGGDIDSALAKKIEDAIKLLEPPPPPPPPTTSPEVTSTTTSTPPTVSSPDSSSDISTSAPPPPPPPPMGGGPPPPPPPPMGGKGAKPAAIKTRPPPKVPKPSHPLKPLQWVKLPPTKVNESVFNILGEMNDINLPWQTIENDFAAKVIVREKKIEKPKGPAQVIDGKLGQNISIFLSQFKTRTNQELIRAITNMDESIISRDQVKQMAKLLPSKDDMAALKEFLSAQDRSKLSTADQYCIDIGAFPFAAEKMALFSLRLEFSTRCSDIKPNIATVSLACEEIFKSKKILRLIEIILVLGNFINYGTVRGDQSGYKIDCLFKLADTKTSDLSANLIHTLIKYCTEKEPHLLTFSDEMPSLGAAKKTLWSGVVADIAALSRDVSQCKSIIENFQKSNEPFPENMVSFLTTASSEVEKLKKLQTATEESFKKLCTYFAEDHSKVTPEEFFEIFARFSQLIETGTEFIQQQKEQIEKEAKREAQKQARAEKAAAKKIGSKAADEKSDEEDIVNDLLIAVRDGDAFRRRRRVGNSKQLNHSGSGNFDIVINYGPNNSGNTPKVTSPSK
eukprot:gene11401-13964_t